MLQYYYDNMLGKTSELPPKNCRPTIVCGHIHKLGENVILHGFELTFLLNKPVFQVSFHFVLP